MKKYIILIFTLICCYSCNLSDDKVQKLVNECKLKDRIISMKDYQIYKYDSLCREYRNTLEKAINLYTECKNSKK